jgi:putative membrane protein insertion efficiency factor
MSSAVYRSIKQVPRYLAVALVLFYQRILSPMKSALLGPGGCCRFYPTCSEYAIQSIKVHGVFKGILLAALRLGKCQPFHRGGYDPVQPVTSQFQTLPKPESLLDLSGKS